MRTVTMRMVSQHMHVLAEHLCGLKADHAGTGRIDENTQPLQIHAKNPLTCGGQHEAQGVTPGVGDAQATGDCGLERIQIKVHGHDKQAVCQTGGHAPNSPCADGVMSPAATSPPDAGRDNSDHVPTN